MINNIPNGGLLRTMEYHNSKLQIYCCKENLNAMNRAWQSIAMRSLEGGGGQWEQVRMTRARFLMTCHIFFLYAVNVAFNY
jgi:hypothetical protein